MEDESLALDEATQSISNLKMDSSTSNSNNNYNNILRVRRYDVSISYDNYYRTPRIWLFGYDENGSPLEPTAIFEDVMTDYAKRTVTIDPHPHLSRPNGKRKLICD
jgi:ubiquitin-like-conjugating enzyme ATG3